MQSAPRAARSLARLDPRTISRRQASDALAQGAAGFKLHPRAEYFRLEHPGVETILGAAAEARRPVLIHAGAGVGSLGAIVTYLAARHRECPIVLAHAAVSDLAWLWRVASEHPNLFFDTSWWNASDLIALVPPGQILFGSDEPYMDLETVLAITLRCARFAGLPPEAIELVAGGQLENLLAGRPAVDAGPAPGSAIRGGAERLVEALIEEAASGSAEAPWSLAMALAILVTPPVEAAAPVG